VDIRVNPWLAIENCPWLISATDEGLFFFATDEHGFSRMKNYFRDGH